MIPWSSSVVEWCWCALLKGIAAEVEEYAQ
jgi:hypothetical protein